MENRYHKHLTFTDEYVPNVNFSQWDVENLQWFEFHKNLHLDELNNIKFVNLIHSLGMTSKWIEVFQTPPNKDGIIHSDNTEYLEWSKIVFQYGAKGSTMRWWKSDHIQEISTDLKDLDVQYNLKCNTTHHSHYHGQILVSTPELSELQYEEEIGIASLVNVGPLHSSHNPTSERRFVITVALFDFEGNRILWDDAVSRLSTYIRE